MKDEADGRRLTRICIKHQKIDCELCKKTREWDELLRRVSKPANVSSGLRTINDRGKSS